VAVSRQSFVSRCACIGLYANPQRIGAEHILYVPACESHLVPAWPWQLDIRRGFQDSCACPQIRNQTLPRLFLGLPLPWMLGAMFSTMIAAVGGLPVLAPSRIRPFVVAVIGVMLGARFTSEILGQMQVWAGTLSLLLLFVLVSAALVVPFYRFVGGFDWKTAYFAGMPGGLAEMVEIGEARGADVRQVVLAHSLRIVVTIAMVALWFRVIEGYAVGRAILDQGPPLQLVDAALLLACAVFGSLAGRFLGLPAPAFLGPMILSAALHMAGITEGSPPGLLVNGAQVILGTVIGCRFSGIRAAELARAAWLSLLATLLSLVVALAFGLVMQRHFGIALEQGLLALAPGGLTEMGLVALAIHADVAFVALHHAARILFVILLAPFAFRLLGGERNGT